VDSKSGREVIDLRTMEVRGEQLIALGSSELAVRLAPTTLRLRALV
jgi:hypothetical protein